ncbi:MAG: hypothetical protein ACJ790_20265 [Myxococcaceae bacterium]
MILAGSSTSPSASEVVLDGDGGFINREFVVGRSASDPARYVVASADGKWGAIVSVTGQMLPVVWDANVGSYRSGIMTDVGAMPAGTIGKTLAISGNCLLIRTQSGPRAFIFADDRLTPILSPDGGDYGGVAALSQNCSFLMIDHGSSALGLGHVVGTSLIIDEIGSRQRLSSLVEIAVGCRHDGRSFVVLRFDDAKLKVAPIDADGGLDETYLDRNDAQDIPDTMFGSRMVMAASPCE